MLNNNLFLALTAGLMLTVSCLSPASAQSNEELKQEIEFLKERLAALEGLLTSAKTGGVKEIAPAKPRQTAKADDPIVKSKPGLVPTMATSDGVFTFNPRGRLILDYSRGSDDNGNLDFDATKARAAWIGIHGTAFNDDIRYRLDVDLGSNKVSVKDAFVEMKVGNIKYAFGQTRVPNSLEWLTVISQTTFMERASFKEALGLARAVGLRVTTSGDVWGASGGIYRGSNSDESDKEGWSFAGRAHYGGKLTDGTWLVGGSVRYRELKEGSFRYRARPFSSLADRLVDLTGSDSDFLYAGEFAMEYGGFFGAAEFARLSAKDLATDGSNATLQGGYAELGWTITGENRPLNLKNGTFGRPKVAKNIHDGGVGLWQIAARYDFIDLTADGLLGGEQDTYLLGISWYPNRYTRLMLNYSHSEISGLDSADNSVDTLGLRFNIDW